MKNMRIGLTVLLCLVLSGCSLLGEVNNTLDYVNNTTAFIRSLTTSAEQLPSLAEQAVTDMQSRTALIQQLEQIKQNIAQFNAGEYPQIAEDIHRQITALNETLLNEINRFLEQINGGAFDLNSLANSEIIQTINKIAQLLAVLEQLGG